MSIILISCRCLAHVFHLATRALISTYSKAPFYDPESPDLTVTMTDGRHDEIGLVCAIVVKARSSAQRKQLFADIQRCPPHACPEPEVTQLLLDMPIRWSSTYVMIDRAGKKKNLEMADNSLNYVDTFVYELGLRQPTQEKCDQMIQMKLTANEWKCVGLFASLLVHADNAQQNFSSDASPSLHLALPALEALHKAWDSHSIQSKYMIFSTGLNAGVNKIVEYYGCTADLDAYTMAMLLDPSFKDAHFKKHWGAELHIM
ncbi:hypothetical protein PAXRUDRAFT_179887 [Paxillus rubicundulus Ve08.2h10]|uniref:Uncharacterized protein n=1 Tax=Paxillus rubicundulus Ve08.2h10 TaxID=930991 RepID=A0A0D0BMA8_9AGAM|nr:hypothetical protein PAXRUDRAFT_179887 [Paxillus rubicundulus Ve08.2h10]